MAERSRRVLTDREGRFEIDRLATGVRYAVRALESFGSAAVQNGVTPGDTVELRLSRPAAVSGTVRDAAGAPVPHFVIQALSVASESQQAMTVSDSSGRFELGNLAPGHVDLTFATPAGDAASSSLELTPGQKVSDLRIVLERPLAMGDGDDRSPVLQTQ
jgi:hypothetical protein